MKLSDVAAAAKVSVPAASMALANHPRISRQTRRRVWAVSRGLGYRQKAVGRGTLAPAPEIEQVGCACLGESFDRPVNARCFAEITAFASRIDIQVRTACFEDLSDSQQVHERVMRFAEPLDGIALTGMVNAPLMEILAAAHVPCVVVGDPMAPGSQFPVDVVTFDHQAAGRMAAAHLFARGHKRVAFVCDTLYAGGSNSRWLDGYRLAHFDAGVPIDSDLIGVTNVVDGGTPQVLTPLLGQASPPTAFVVVNSYLANTLLISLKEVGRPIDVVGLYQEQPPEVDGLAVIRYPLKTYCEAAMKRLVHLCQNPGEPPARILVPFETRNF